MPGDDDSKKKGIGEVSQYEEALDALSSLITNRDKYNKGDCFESMYDYVKILDLDEDIARTKIIHVAGTKGKGSTCAFTESILRHCGLRTGLFTSPHLIDIRERFRINGEEISEDKFSANFWWCFNKLKEETNENLPMPTFFRFLALLAFKIFAAEQVDVAILEVGLGGQFDATNVVQRPIVCGISSLGFDHMEILGNNLGEIAGQKAGIFKHGVPAFTVPQPDEAMSALEKKASQLDVLLKVAKPLDAHLLNGLQLGLAGEHQFQNAGLAISLCRSWLKKTGHLEGMYLDQAVSLPEQFVKGLAATSFPGRAQIVPDRNVEMDSPGGLVFYLDGAHSPESMDICGRWFSLAIKDDVQHQNSSPEWSQNDSRASHKTRAQVLLFNCMTVRDPLLLLPRLRSICAHNGVHFQKAIFVPNQSVHHKVGSHSSPSTDPQVDLSWQLALQRVWENLVHGDKGGDGRTLGHICQEGTELSKDKIRNGGSSSVFPSLPSAIKWLRDTAQQNRSVRLQVLVTGSLHLIGDVLRLIKR